MSHAKKRILITTSTFSRWEDDILPSFVYELSKRLAKHLDVYVLAPHSRGAKVFEQVDGMNIFRFRYFPARHEKLCERAILPNLKENPLLWLQVPFFLISQFFAIARIVNKNNIDVIHAHWVIPQGFIAVLYKLLLNHNIKIVVTGHGKDLFGLRFWPFSALKRWTLNNIDSLTVVSNALKNEAINLGIRNNLPIKVVPMGVDLSLFNPDRYNENIKKKYQIKGPFILFVGRLSEKKGVEYLINAMPTILNEYPDAKLLIIGEGEREAYLKNLSENLGLLDRSIIFTGAIPNKELPQYYATADIFIGPSISEGLGLVFVESIGSSTITMGTNLPAIADVIEDGKTGFIVEQKNSKQIAEKVKYILSNRDNFKDMSKKARKIIVDKFDWNLISKKYTQILERM